MKNISIRRATVQDYDAIMRLINALFFPKDPVGFVGLFPHIYTDPAFATQQTYIACAGERVVGHVGIYPLRVRSADGGELRVAGIGAVGTDPEYRGRGIMTQLLTTAIEAMKEVEYDLSVLWGDRMRYGHFGWEVCGLRLEWQLDPRLARAAADEPAVLEPFDATKHADTVLQAWNGDSLGTLHDQASLLGLLSRKQWQTRVVVDASSFAFVTYERTDKRIIVDKLVGPPHMLPGILLALAESSGDSRLPVFVQCPPAPHPVAELGLRIGKDMTLHTISNARIIRTDRLPTTEFADTDIAKQVRQLLGTPARLVDPILPFWIERPAAV